MTSFRRQTPCQPEIALGELCPHLTVQCVDRGPVTNGRIVVPCKHIRDDVFAVRARVVGSGAAAGKNNVNRPRVNALRLSKKFNAMLGDLPLLQPPAKAALSMSDMIRLLNNDGMPDNLRSSRMTPLPSPNVMWSLYFHFPLSSSVHAALL